MLIVASYLLVLAASALSRHIPQPINIVGDICSTWNGRRIFVDTSEVITLTAKNITQRPGGDSCVTSFYACPFCHFVFKFEYLDRSRCRHIGNNICSCSDLTIHEPPHEKKYEVVCEFMSRHDEQQSKTNQLQVELQTLLQQKHAFTLHISTKKNLFLYTDNATCDRGLDEEDHIESPFFPNYYPSTYQVDYLFINPIPGGMVRIVFQDFRIAVDSYFEVFQRSNIRLRVLTGKLARPPIIQSDLQAIKVRFMANGVSGPGYRFTYHFLNCNSSSNSSLEVPRTDCGGSVSNLGGSITMSHMSRTEFRRYDCVWVVRPPTMTHYKMDMAVRVQRLLNMGEGTDITITEGIYSNGKVVERLTEEDKIAPSLNNNVTELSGKVADEHVVSANTGFYIRLQGSLGPYSALAITYSVFNYEDCFSVVDIICNNSRCLISGLQCDGFDHCGDGSDEPPQCYGHLERHWSNYYFPKQASFLSSPTKVTLLLALCLTSFGLLALSLVIWRFNVAGRAAYARHRTRELIEQLERRQSEAGQIIEDDPPEYDAPPDYDEALKLPITPMRRHTCATVDPGTLLNEPRLLRVTLPRRSVYDIPREAPPAYETEEERSSRRPKQRMRRKVSRSATCPPPLHRERSVTSAKHKSNPASPHNQPRTLIWSLSVIDQMLNRSQEPGAFSSGNNSIAISMNTEEGSICVTSEVSEQGNGKVTEADSIIQRAKRLLFSKQPTQPKHVPEPNKTVTKLCNCQEACSCNAIIPVKVRKLAFEPKPRAEASGNYNIQDIFKTCWNEPGSDEESGRKPEAASADFPRPESETFEQASVSFVQQAKERLFSPRREQSNSNSQAKHLVKTKAPPCKARIKMKKQKSEPSIFYLDIEADETGNGLSLPERPMETCNGGVVSPTSSAVSDSGLGRKSVLSTERRSYSCKEFGELTLSPQDLLLSNAFSDPDVSSPLSESAHGWAQSQQWSPKDQPHFQCESFETKADNRLEHAGNRLEHADNPFEPADNHLEHAGNRLEPADNLFDPDGNHLEHADNHLEHADNPFDPAGNHLEHADNPFDLADNPFDPADNPFEHADNHLENPDNHNRLEHAGNRFEHANNNLEYAENYPEQAGSYLECTENHTENSGSYPNCSTSNQKAFETSERPKNYPECSGNQLENGNDSRSFQKDIDGYPKCTPDSTGIENPFVCASNQLQNIGNRSTTLEEYLQHSETYPEHTNNSLGHGNNNLECSTGNFLQRAESTDTTSFFLLTHQSSQDCDFHPRFSIDSTCPLLSRSQTPESRKQSLDQVSEQNCPNGGTGSFA